MVSGGVHETVVTRPRDVRRAGDAVDLRWVKLRRKCGNPECPRKTFTEWVPDLPPRCRITARLREQAGHEIAERGITPAEAARHAGISWLSAHEAFAAAASATRSLPAALRGRDGLVHRLVDAEDLRQSGDPEDLQDPLLGADQIQRAVVGPHPLQAPDQYPEAGGVEEPDLAQVDDELVAALADRSMSSSRSRGAVYISISPCTSMTSMPSLAW